MIRKIHLDFHTTRDVPEVGAGFEPEVFADRLAAAHVNYLATPGRCQFGHVYFDAKVCSPHPHLARKDLFPATVRACVARGIKVQAYFSFGLDDVAAERHPEWRQTYKDGTFAQWSAKHMCFASPYVDEMLIPQALETIDLCPGICGFWFDICLYMNGAFYSPSFTRMARAMLGPAADDEANRWSLSRQIVREACQRVDAAVKARMPDAENYFNSLVVPGEAENIPLQPYQEVENPILFGGPEVMTAHGRWLRWHPGGKLAPYKPGAAKKSRRTHVIGLVSRFQGPWMDPGTVRTPDQMRFDVARTVALGCEVSMGDHRHPDGSLDAEVYRRIGATYADVKACEPWLDGAEPCREAVLLSEVSRGAPLLLPTFPPSTLQAARMLEEIGLQYDVVSVEEDIPEAKLVVWPGERPGTPRLMDQLSRHIARGGAILAMHAAADAAESKRTADLFGVRVIGALSGGGETARKISEHGHVQKEQADDSALANHFLRFLPDVGLPAFAQVISRPACAIEALAGTRVLAERFPSVSAMPPCVGPISNGPAVVQKGNAIYSAMPLFAEAAETGAPFPAEAIGRLCDILLTARMVRHSAGSTVAANLLRVKQGYALHLVHWALDRWGAKINAAATFPSLGPIDIDVAVPEAVHEVKLQPAGASLAFQCRDGRCRFRVPSLHVWQIVSLRLTA